MISGSAFSTIFFNENTMKYHTNVNETSNLAIDAESRQHWCWAAILWRRINEIDAATVCEEVAALLAIKNKCVLGSENIFE